MAKKKVYFFKIELYDRATGRELDYKLIPDIVKDIVDNKSIVDGNTRIINLTMAGDDLHTSLDIYRYKNDYMFVRSSKQKPTNSMITREYSTFTAERLLSGKSEDVQGIEAYTYMYIDYNRGILALSQSQGAPSEKAFSTFFELYNAKYEVNLIAIPNPNGVEKIYGKAGAEISTVDLCIPVPDPIILESLLGVKGSKLLHETTANNIVVNVQFSSKIKKGKLTSNVEESNKLIDCIREKSSLYKEASVHGKYEGTNMEDYFFYGENFYFLVDINISRMEQGKKRFLSPDEITSLYKQKIAGLYNQYRDYISSSTNRKE